MRRKRGFLRRRDAFLRIGGWAAVIAGVMRVAASFTSSLGSEVERQSLYFIIDLLLLIGVFAAYLHVQEVVRGGGAAGFLTTVAGILLVRSSRAVPGVDLYPAGALAVALGWATLGLASWRAGTASVFVPFLFVLSVVIAIVGPVVASSPSAFVASGVVFGAAVVGVGRQVLAAVGKNLR